MDFATFNNHETEVTKSARRRREQREREEKRMRRVSTIAGAFVKWGAIVAVVASVAQSII